MQNLSLVHLAGVFCTVANKQSWTHGLFHINRRE